MRGTFVAIEGVDNSGKSTQVTQLTDLLERAAVPYHYIHFPRTEQAGYGETIAMFLRGEFGTVRNVHPYLVALLFAGDRATSKDEIAGWLDRGDFVITDRYLYSNLAFQGAKLVGEAEKVRFRQWLRNIELNVHKIPKPNLSIYLKVPSGFVTEGSQVRQANETREYLRGQGDIHELDSELQSQVAQEYESLVRTCDDFVEIDCCSTTGFMDSPKTIHDRLLSVLRERRLLPTSALQER